MMMAKPAGRPGCCPYCLRAVSGARLSISAAASLTRRLTNVDEAPSWFCTDLPNLVSASLASPLPAKRALLGISSIALVRTG